MKVTLCVAALISVSASSDAQSIRPVAPAAGAYSVSFSAEFDKSQGLDPESMFVVTLAYFASDHLELRLPLSFEQLVGPEEVTYGFGARWHFQKGKLLDPFIGGIYEHAKAGSFVEDFVGGVAGINYFVANNVAITGVAEFGSDRSNAVHQNVLSIGWGLTVFFSGK